LNYSIDLEKIAKELIKIEKIDEIGRKSQEISLDIIKNVLESIDEEIFKSRTRKDFYESKGKEERTIVFLQGAVTFKRRRYHDLRYGKNVYLLDVILGLGKRKRYTPGVIKLAIENALEMRSYKQAGEKTLANIGIVIGRSSIYKWLQECIFEEKEIKKKECEVLTISADGTFPHINKTSKNKELKIFNFYSIREKTEKNKYKIDSEIYSPRRQGAILRTWEQTLDYIYKVYDVSKIKKIYVCGDGAGWIKKIMDESVEFKNNWIREIEIEYVIDKYHFKKELYGLPGQDKYQIEEILNYYKEGDVTPFKDDEWMKKELKTKENKRRAEYILKNDEYTQGWYKEDYLGCNMEMVMSHYICDRFKGSPKIWGKMIYKYSYGLCLLKNKKLNIKIEEEKDIDYIENIKIRFKDKELYYGNYKERSNMPLLNEGNGGIRNWAINSLAHY